MKKSILFIDIASSSIMWKNHPQQMSKSLARFDKLVHFILSKYFPQGMVIKTIGDAYMISFNTWKHSLQFAIKLQKFIIQKQHVFEMSKAQPFQIRIGIAHGPVETKMMNVQGHQLIDYFGNTVNTASRMESKVSPINGIGIVCLDDSDHFTNVVSQSLQKTNIRYEILSFQDDCVRFRRQLSAHRNRSGRLLCDYHYSCHDISELKGVDSVKSCFKIYLK